MNIMNFLKPGTNRVELPCGYYQNIEPIKEQGIIVTSADPKSPAYIEQLIIYADNVGVDKLIFPTFIKDESALVMRGQNNFVQQCQFGGNHIAIQAEKTSWITHNIIMGFSQDGIQFCGDKTIIESNVIGRLNPDVYRDKQPGEIAHVDCMQGWAGHPDSSFRHAERYNASHHLTGVVVLNNTLFDVPESPLQGITFFDGCGFDWEVSGNTILLYGPHPLTLLGQQDVKGIDSNYLVNGTPQLLPARRLLADGKSWEAVMV